MNLESMLNLTDFGAEVEVAVGEDIAKGPASSLLRMLSSEVLASEIIGIAVRHTVLKIWVQRRSEGGN